MTVVDTSVVVDFLLGTGVEAAASELLAAGPAAAPDVLVFEVLTVLRRAALREELDEARAAGAVEDLGDLAVELFPSLPLRERTWAMRHRLTVADALFAALAMELAEPLATKDGGLAAAAKDAGIPVLRLA